uniref:Chromosome 18 open reading frame 21 n=1 Tax=Accipiter nisus TaxID=211598 RepID=A0A8B9MNR9_9AVES
GTSGSRTRTPLPHGTAGEEPPSPQPTPAKTTRSLTAAPPPPPPPPPLTPAHQPAATTGPSQPGTLLLRPRVPAGPRRNAAHPPHTPHTPPPFLPFPFPFPSPVAGPVWRRFPFGAVWAGSGGSWRWRRRAWRPLARARRGSCCGRSATAEFLVPDGYRVRLKPKMKVTPQMERALKREAKNHKLNMKQTKLLKKYRESRSVLLVTCNSCNKTTRHYGKSRDFLATQTQKSGTPSIQSSLRTPGVKIPSANKVTPVSCSRLGSTGNSPSSLTRTHVSGQARTSSASKTPRNSRFHFSKLKRMLNLEEKEKSQKADLKTFLTLL